MNPSVHVRSLTKSYGTFHAVKGVDFDIYPGEVFGLLGPNGAGKTTTVEILEGLRPRNGGDVTVLGFDPGNDSRRVKDRIGVCLQATNLPDRITDAGNALVFHGPTVHREMQLWVDAGIPPAVALQAATWNAARLLRAEQRIGLVQPGHDANLLVVDGDPTRDISATERISMVVLKGERVRRVDLFDESKNALQ